MSIIEKKIIVKSAQGLHARPAALFVQTAVKFTSQISLEKDGEVVNGKSIMDILTLGTQKDTVVKLIVEGDDAEEAFPILEELLSRED